MADTAQRRLEQLLYILPVASERGGASLAQLAHALDTTEDEVLRVLQEAYARAFYLPAGAGDSIQITIDEDRVSVFAGTHFRRPVRLTRREALALGIGLRMLAAEAESPEREHRLDLAIRLEQSLQVPPRLRDTSVREWRTLYTTRQDRLDEETPFSDAESDMQLAVSVPAEADSDTFVLHIEPDDSSSLDVQFGHDEFRGFFADSIRDRQRVRVSYLKAGDSEPRERTLEPLRLVYANGRWYVLARDPETADVRVFRLDRILDASALNQRFAQAETDLARFVDDAGRVFSAAAASTAVVRYSARIAPWILERTQATRHDDGSVTLEHKVSDPDWLVRHVLQYGSEAQVLEPADLRNHVARAARTLASA